MQPDRAVQTESTEQLEQPEQLARLALASTGGPLPWSSGTTYNLNDAVFYNGSSYVCTPRFQHRQRA